MPVGDPRQALVAPVPEQLPAALEDLARGRPRQCAVQRTGLGQQQQVLAGVAGCQLRRGQARGLLQVVSQQAPLGLAQGFAAEPSQRLLNVPVGCLAVGKADFRLGAAGQEPLDLFQALERFWFARPHKPAVHLSLDMTNTLKLTGVVIGLCRRIQPMARTLAVLPPGAQVTDYISLG